MRKVFRQVITGFVWSRRDGGDMLERWLQTLIRKEKVVGGENLLHFALQPRGGEKNLDGQIPKRRRKWRCCSPDLEEKWELGGGQTVFDHFR